MTSDPRTARDTGLRRVRLATGWLAAGALALTGAIVGWEVRTTQASGATSPAVTRAPATADGSSSSPSSGGGAGGSDSDSETPTDPGDASPTDPGYASPTDPGYSGGDQLQSPGVAPAPSNQGPIASSGGS